MINSRTLMADVRRLEEAIREPFSHFQGRELSEAFRIIRDRIGEMVREESELNGQSTQTIEVRELAK